MSEEVLVSACPYSIKQSPVYLPGQGSLFLLLLFIDFRKRGKVREKEIERKKERESFVVPFIYALIG